MTWAGWKEEERTTTQPFSSQLWYSSHSCTHRLIRSCMMLNLQGNMPFSYNFGTSAAEDQTPGRQHYCTTS